MKIKIILPILIVGLIFVSGCTLPDGTTEGEGTLVMQITDRPADFVIDSAIVTISNVEVHKAEFATESNENEGNDSGSKEQNQGSEAGWYTVVEEAQTFDLIEIKDIKEFLGSTELGTGRYTQIRLNVDSATVTVGGVEHELEVPSESIKLTKSFNIEANETTTLTLDFEANESIHKTGSDKYILRPTIKVIQE